MEEKNTFKKGIIAGAFDVIHPGYVRMFKDAKKHCNHLTIALHLDPSIERDIKLKPIHTKEERKEILMAFEDVDDVVYYEVENGFLNYLKSGDYDIRFLGTDYLKGNYTGKDIPIDIVWLNRNHNYSSTHLKAEIYNSVKYRKDRVYVLISFNNIGNLGRLANQMFQYASLKGIARNRGYDYSIPPEKFLVRMTH